MTKNNLRIVIINSEQWKTINLIESNNCKSSNSNGDKMTSSQWLVISPMDSI